MGRGSAVSLVADLAFELFCVPLHNCTKDHKFSFWVLGSRFLNWLHTGPPCVDFQPFSVDEPQEKGEKFFLDLQHIVQAFDSPWLDPRESTMTKIIQNPAVLSAKFSVWQLPKVMFWRLGGSPTLLLASLLHFTYGGGCHLL